MTTIEYLDEVIQVPTKWEEIKLKHYENFYQDKPENTRERVALVAKICNIEPAKLLDLPADIFNIVVEHSFFIFEEFVAPPSPKVKINGVTYVIPIEEKLSLGAYIDADETQKSGENVISGILAIVCRPVGEDYDDELTEERTAMFGELPMSQVWPLLAFFLHCKNALETRTIAFTNLTQAVESLPLNILHSLKLGDGIKLSRMWQIIKYFFLIRSLRYRLRRLLRLYNTGGIRVLQTQRKGN
jgi:hypothetical protein